MGQEDLFLREVTNGASFLIQLFMGVAIISFMWRRVQEFGVSRSDPILMMLIGMACYLIGVSIVRGGTWATFISNSFGFKDPIDAFDEIIVLGTAIAIMGGLCTIRAWSRDEWGHWYWITAGVLAVIVPLVVHYLIGLAT